MAGRRQFEDHLRSIRLLESDQVDDQAQNGTARGKVSAGLRREGYERQAHGDLVGAHQLFEAALDAVRGDTNPAALASAQYDVAESYLSLPVGERRHNLMRAFEYATMAADNQARRATAIRHSRSLDQLARIRRAMVNKGALGDEDLLDEAEGFYRRAIDAVANHGPIGRLTAANYLSNLGNLQRQRQDLPGAVRSQKQALEWSDAALNDFGSTFSGGGDRWVNYERKRVALRMNYAVALEARGRIADRRLVERLLRANLDDPAASPLGRARSLERLAGAYLKWSRPDDARRCLESVDSRLLGPDELLDHLLTWRRLGDHDSLIRRAGAAVSELFERRRLAASEFLAGEYARQLQTLAALIVEAEISIDRPFAGFVKMEQALGLMFDEALQSAQFDLRDPVTSELVRLRAEHSLACNALEHLAHMTSGHPVELRSQFLTDALPTVEAYLTAVGETPKPVLEAPDPVAFLESRARKHVAIASRYASALRVHEESFGRSYTPPDLTPDDLARWPEHAFVVAHLEAPSLLIAVWWADGHLSSVADLASQSSPEVNDDAAWLPRALAHLLEQIPDDRHWVFVPSTQGLRTPWAAELLPDGRRLIEAVRSITISPTMGPYLVERAPRPPRAGHLLVAPGHALERPTISHRKAFSRRAEAHALLDRAASPDAVRAAVAGAEIAAFFSHAEYGADGAHIELAGGRLDLTDLGNETLWTGMERVELWACQTGVNEMMDPFSPRSHDAFGMDALLHRVGVRSTLGSLWPIPDVTTGLIADRYALALTDGKSPAEALADAQRWYLQVFVPGLRAQESEEAQQDYLDAMLGSEDRGADARDNLAQWVEPRAWAGFRFMGAPDRAPTTPWTEPPPLDEAGRATIAALLELVPVEA